MPQQLRTLDAALAENPDKVPCTYRQLTTLFNSSSRRPNSLFSPLWVLYSGGENAYRQVKHS